MSNPHYELSEESLSLKARTISKILVKDVMTADVVVVNKYNNIDEAVRLLSEHNISALPVVDKENHVIGVISEADILSMTGMKRGHTLKDILKHFFGEPLSERKMGDLVGDIMTSPAITVSSDIEINEVVKVLDEKRIKRLPVVDEKNKLVGIISRADIVRAMSRKTV